MNLQATLHLPEGRLDLRVGPGEATEIPAAAVIHLARRHDHRDRIHLAGRRIDRRGTAGRVRAGFGLVTGAPVAGSVTVGDHLAAIAGTRRAEALLATSPLLARRRDDPAGVLSGGERRVLALLRAAATDPVVVVLDRAGAGLDDEALAWAGHCVAAWRAAGVAVLVRVGRAAEAEWVGER